MKTLNELREQNPNIEECRVFIDKQTGVLYFATEDEPKQKIENVDWFQMIKTLYGNDEGYKILIDK